VKESHGNRISVQIYNRAIRFVRARWLTFSHALFSGSYFLRADKSPAIYRSFPCCGNLGTFGGLVRDDNRPIRLRYPLSPKEANHVWHVIKERHLCLINNIFRIVKNQLSARKQQVKWDRLRPYTCYRSISLSRKILKPQIILVICRS